MAAGWQDLFDLVLAWHRPAVYNAARAVEEQSRRVATESELMLRRGDEVDEQTRRVADTHEVVERI